VLRVYTDKEGRAAGYTWSVGGREFKSQAENPMVFGRFMVPMKHTSSLQITAIF
jgi:hypothetical protein